MRESIFPITFIQQLNGALRIKINALYAGYQYLNYHLAESDKLHRRQLDQNDEFIITDFSEGTGHYYFYLSDDENNRTPLYSVYVTKDSDKDIYNKIVSYINAPEDIDYINGAIAEIQDTEYSYTYQLSRQYAGVKNPQDTERHCFAQLISAAERYENTLATAHNRTNIRGIVCHYGARFGVTLPMYITSVEVMEVRNGAEYFCYKTKPEEEFYPMCTPGHFYRFNVYADSELVISLVHYQLDEEGAAYIWEQQMSYLEQQEENLEELERNMFDDTELAYSGIELSVEDKDRILEERRCQPRNYLIERVKVSPSPLDSKILEVNIPDYNILSGGTYYLSVTERDILNESMFDLRFKINNQTMLLDTRKELLDDELMICIRDSRGASVSKYTRYNMNEDAADYIMEYNEKLNAVETYEYVEQLLQSFDETFTDTEVHSAFTDIVMPLAKGLSCTKAELKDEIVMAVGFSQKLRGERDNVLYFIEDNWLKQFTYDSTFFGTVTPTLYYSEDRLVMPRADKEYVLCAEYYDIPNKQKFVTHVASKDQDGGISVPTNKGDLCCVYAIDTKTGYRSGFVFFNNFGTKKYYHDQIEVEVDIYNG